MTSNENDDRRESRENRRVIPRFTEPTVKNYIGLAAKTLSLALAAGLIYAVTLAIAYWQGGRLTSSEAVTKFIFVLTILGFVEANLFRVLTACRSYLANDSQARLVRLFEVSFMSLAMIAGAAVLFGIVHVITLF